MALQEPSFKRRSLSPNVQRFCVCGNVEENYSDAYYYENSSNNIRNGRNDFIYFILLFLNVAFVSSSKQTIFICLLIIIMYHQVLSHNWLGSNARSGKGAPAGPCKPATPNVYHAQVGFNQKFYVEPSAGHGGPIYLIVFKGVGLEHTKGFRKSWRQYLIEAPASSNKAQQDNWKRYCKHYY